jgi:hypothetical protein
MGQLKKIFFGGTVLNSVFMLAKHSVPLATAPVHFTLVILEMGVL